jgi:hypothetical protein
MYANMTITPINTQTMKNKYGRRPSWNRFGKCGTAHAVSSSTV